MFHISDSKFKSTGDLFQAINELLSFYGFNSLDGNIKTKPVRKLKKNISDIEYLDQNEKKILSISKEFAGGYKADTEKSEQFYASDDLSKLKSELANYYLHIVGEGDSFAEALLVFSLDLIARKFFNSDIVVEINSLGDKDSAEKYLFDIKRFLRKHKKYLPEKVLIDFQDAKIAKALMRLNADNSPLLDNAPNIMDYLSDQAQKHLYSFLNYLENMGIAYNLNPSLFGSSGIWKHLLIQAYTIDGNGIKTAVAFGGRHSNALSAMSGKENDELCSLVINFEKKGRKFKIGNVSKNNNLKVYFIQLGVLAKSQGARILEELQDAGFNVGHSLANLSLLEQYKLALDFGAKYAIILGHKEAIDKTLIIRNIETQTQDMIPQDKLLKILKKLT